MICSLSEFWQESILANFVSFVHNETAEIFHDETFYGFFFFISVQIHIGVSDVHVPVSVHDATKTAHIRQTVQESRS